MVSSAALSLCASAAAKASRLRSKRCTERQGSGEMTERDFDDFAVGEKLSRRSLVAGATFFGAAMAAICEVAKAEGAGSGSYSNAAIALPDGAPKTREEQIRAVRIARAMRAGTSAITEHD